MSLNKILKIDVVLLILAVLFGFVSIEFDYLNLQGYSLWYFIFIPVVFAWYVIKVNRR